jgi:hypothetical protein
MLDMLPLSFARQLSTLYTLPSARYLGNGHFDDDQVLSYSLYPPTDLREDLGGFIEIAHLGVSACGISCVVKDYSPAHLVPYLRRESGPPLPIMYVLQFSLLTRGSGRSFIRHESQYEYSQPR